MEIQQVQTGATKLIQIYVSAVAGGAALTGATDLFVRVRRQSDGKILDWADMTFKAAAWTDKEHLLAELDAANLPGVYAYALNTTSIVTLVANDIYQFYYFQTPGVSAIMPVPNAIEMGKWLDNIDGAISDCAKPTDILSDATPFAGANIANLDAAVSDCAKPTDILSDATPFAGASIATIASDVDTALSLTHGVGAWDGIPPASDIADAVWDALRADHADAGSFGQSTNLIAAGLQTDAVNELVDALWDEPTSHHVTPGTTGNGFSNMDAKVSTRAVAGDAMTLAAGAVTANALHVGGVAKISDGVWDEALAGHVGAGSAGQAQNHLDSDISDCAVPGDLMMLDANALTGVAIDATGSIKIANKVLDTALAGHAVAGSVAIALDHLDADVTSRAAPNAQMALTIAARGALVDDIWDEPVAGHAVGGTTGKDVTLASLAPTAAVIADAVWDEALAGHVGAGSSGKAEGFLDDAITSRAKADDPMTLSANAVSAAALAAAGVAKISDGVWDEALAGHTTAGTSGKKLGDL